MATLFELGELEVAVQKRRFPRGPHAEYDVVISVPGYQLRTTALGKNSKSRVRLKEIMRRIAWDTLVDFAEKSEDLEKYADNLYDFHPELSPRDIGIVVKTLRGIAPYFTDAIEEFSHQFGVPRAIEDVSSEDLEETLGLLADRCEVLTDRRPEGGADLGSIDEEREHVYPPHYRPPHYYGKGKGRKQTKTFETQEERAIREQKDRALFFYEETGSLEPQDVLFFQEHALTEEKRRAYARPPVTPEITLADIYDVIHCRGRWAHLAYGGWPCRRGGTNEPMMADDVDRAVQYLTFQGFRPMS